METIIFTGFFLIKICYRVPLLYDFKHISIQQGNICLDALGYFSINQSPGIYACHQGGGNQEWLYSSTHGYLRHAGSTDLCLAINEIGFFINVPCNKVFFLFVHKYRIDPLLIGVFFIFFIANVLRCSTCYLYID